MTQGQINELLRKHKLWLNNEEGGEQADLCDANMYGADMHAAYLTWAKMRQKDMDAAVLTKAQRDSIIICD